METKEQLINNIKEWIKLDTDITQLRRLIKEKNEKKKNLTDNLMSVMKNNEIDCFDINGGALIYKKTTIKKPICSKSLLSVLQNYYKEDVKMAEELTKHIMNNREEKIKETVHRKIAKIKEEISL